MEIPQLKNDIRKIPGNLLLVESMHIGVASLKGFPGKMTIAECQGVDGEVVALALTPDAIRAMVEGLQQALEQMDDQTL